MTVLKRGSRSAAPAAVRGRPDEQAGPCSAALATRSAARQRLSMAPLLFRCVRRISSEEQSAFCEEGERVRYESTCCPRHPAASFLLPPASVLRWHVDSSNDFALAYRRALARKNRLSQLRFAPLLQQRRLVRALVRQRQRRGFQAARGQHCSSDARRIKRRVGSLGGVRLVNRQIDQLQ